MKRSKLIAFFLVIAMVITYFPISPVSAGTEKQVEIYAETFDGNLSGWTNMNGAAITNGQIVEGKYQTNTTTGGELRTARTFNGNFTLTYEVKRFDTSTPNDCYVSINIANTSNSSNRIVWLFRPSATNVIVDSGGETSFSAEKLKENTDYVVQVKVADGKAEISFKELGSDDPYTVLGQKDFTLGECKLTFNHRNAKMQLDNIRVFVPTSEANEPRPVKIFTETFDGNLSGWTTQNGTTITNGQIVDGKYQTKTIANGELWTKRAFTGDYTITYEVKRFEAIDTAWFVSLNLYDSSDPTTKRIGWYFRKAGINVKIGSGAEIPFSNYILEENKEYEVRVNVVGGEAEMAVKELDSSGPYTVLGKTAFTPGDCKLWFNHTNTKVQLDNITVYAPGDGDFGFNEKMVRIKIGDTCQPDLINTDEALVAWSSSDSSIATVDSNGIVTGHKSGTAVITAAAGDKSDTCEVVVYATAQKVSLNKGTMTMVVGVNEQLTATVTPADANNKNIVWEVSDPSVVQLYGKAMEAKALLPLKEGNAVVTVTTVDGGYTAQCNITVIAKEENTPGTAIFTADTSGREIPPYLFGIHENDGYQRVGKVKTVEEFKSVENAQVLAEIKAKSIRGAYEGYNYITQTVEGRSLAGGYAPLTLEEIFKIPNLNNIPRSYAVNMKDSDEDILNTIREIRRITAQPMFIELGNEGYAMMYQPQIPTVEDYVARARRLYPQIKAIDPDIKVGIVILNYELAAAIAADPNNFPQNPEDMAYTQGIRAATWNSVIAENNDCYDAVIIHEYSSMQNFNDLTADKLMRFFFKTTVHCLDGWEKQEAQFPGKEFWVTEYGDLPGIFWNPNMDERARLQYMKSPGNAISYMDRFFTMTEDENITLSTYHYLRDSQGFGIIQNEGVLPNYYAFKEIGRIMDGNSHTFAVTLKEGNVREEVITMNAAKEYVQVQDAKAWAFGDGQEIREFAFLNTTDTPISIQVEGYDLKATWKYGGSIELVLPDFLAGKSVNWTDMPQTLPTPEILTGSDFVGIFELAPYSMVIASAAKKSEPVVQFTVTFDVDETQTVVYSTTEGAIQLPPNPEKDGHTFKGWYDAKIDGNEVTVFNKTMTVYAQWNQDSSGEEPGEEPGGGNSGSYIPASYTITVSAGEGGKISPQTSIVAEYATKTFTIIPDEGYEIAEVAVDGKSVGAVTTYTFNSVMGGHSISATFKKVKGPEKPAEPETPKYENPFADVNENQWFYDSIMYVYNHGLISGVSTDKFNPAEKGSRGMIVTILHTLAGKPKATVNGFADIKDGQWYTDAVVWAAENKIISGYGNGLFGPNDNITREQMAVIFYNYARHQGYDLSKIAPLEKFTDNAKASGWAKEALQWMVGTGIMSGKGNNMLDPKGTASRAEMASIMHKFAEQFTELE